MSEKEKELSVEEMRDFIEITSLVSALLKRMESIEKDIGLLKNSFKTIIEKYNSSIEEIGNYKSDVSSYSRNSDRNNKDIKEELTLIKEKLASIEAALIKNEEEVVEKPKKEKKERVDPDEDKVNEIADKILSERGGRQERRLIIDDIVNGFKCSTQIAEKVLALFEKRKLYNPKTNKLTFPKLK